MMLSNHIDIVIGLIHVRSLQEFKLCQSRRGIAALNMENGPREGMKIGSNVF